MGFSEIGPDVRHEAGGATVPSGVGTVILGPFNLTNYMRVGFTVTNLSPSLTLSGVAIQTNPDTHGMEPTAPRSDSWLPGPVPAPAMWVTFDTTTFQNLEAGATRAVSFGHPPGPWWRLARQSR